MSTSVPVLEFSPENIYKIDDICLSFFLVDT